MLKKIGISNLFLLLLIATWRMFLSIPQVLGELLLRQHPGYIGPTLWANLDGIHYLSIALNGYKTYEQAFFPLFPVTLRIITTVTHIPIIFSAFIVVYVTLFFTLFFFWKLTSTETNLQTSIWAILFFISFPSSFFLHAIYTESTFLCFAIASLYFAKKEKYFLAGILGMLASATRLVGVFLLPTILISLYFKNKGNIKNVYSIRLLPLLFIPLGLIGYMTYLGIVYHDPLFFLHAQPAFGAGRSGGSIILLPQVLWRYVKILTSVSIHNYDFYISALELVSFIVVFILLIISYFKKFDRSLVFFGLCGLILPTLSGTLSSIPRYSLTAFVIFIYLASIKNVLLKRVLVCFGLLVQAVLCMYFLQGYFIS